MICFHCKNKINAGSITCQYCGKDPSQSSFAFKTIGQLGCFILFIGLAILFCGPLMMAVGK
jgi:hypothetical protein